MLQVCVPRKKDEKKTTWERAPPPKSTAVFRARFPVCVFLNYADRLTIVVVGGGGGGSLRWAARRRTVKTVVPSVRGRKETVWHFSAATDRGGRKCDHFRWLADGWWARCSSVRVLRRSCFTCACERSGALFLSLAVIYIFLFNCVRTHTHIHIWNSENGICWINPTSRMNK